MFRLRSLKNVILIISGVWILHGLSCTFEEIGRFFVEHYRGEFVVEDLTQNSTKR
jgi:hypothetical protein